MSASYTYLLDTGTISIDTTDLLTDVEGEWQAAFGTTLNTDASTAQGTMIAAEVTARTSVMKNNAELGSVINPALSYATWLDAICSFLGIGRGVNLSTVATGVILAGNNPTPIPAGSRVETINGDIFITIADTVIPTSGSISVSVQSQAFGSIPLPVGSLKIIDGTIGWASATVNSLTTITPGSTQNTDPQLKNKRNKQLAVQGTASAASVYANVLNVPNVTSAIVVENNTGQFAAPVNGVTFTKGSALWVCVAGTPSPAAVAAALYAAHNSGCPWDFGAAGMGVPVNAPDGVTTDDPNTGLPYQVLFTTPLLYDVYINISIKQSAAQSPGAPAISQAILSYAQGLEDGEDGFDVGASVSAFEVGGTVARQYPGLYVKSCQVAVVPAGSAAPAFPADYVYEWVAGRFEQATLQIGNIDVNLL